jgi:hypothetical protein
MKKQIDDFSSIWTLSSGSQSVTQWDDLKVSYLPNQLSVTFQNNAVLSKTFLTVQDVTDYRYLGFTSCYTDNWTFPLYFKIKITGTLKSNEFLFQVNSDRIEHKFFPLIDSNGDRIDDIVSIEITSLQSCYVILADMVVYTDDYPYDIASAVGKLVESKIDGKIQIGTVTASSGASEIRIYTLHKFAERFAVIQIGNEIHQIDSYSVEKTYYKVKFTSNFDGSILANSYTNEPVYLYNPVLVMPKDIEGNTIAVWIDSQLDDEVLQNHSFASEYETWYDTDSNLYEQRRSGQFKYKIIAHFIYRSLETKMQMNDLVMNVSGLNNEVWINGKRFILLSGQKTNIEFEDNTGEIQIPFELEAGKTEWQTRITKINLQTSLTTNSL